MRAQEGVCCVPALVTALASLRQDGGVSRHPAQASPTLKPSFQAYQGPSFGSRMAAQGGEEFSLKWNDHSKVFFAGAEDLAEKQEFTDVTLAAGGKLITAHKMVLSICSPFFQRLFKQLGTVGPEKTVVYLKDVQPRHLDLLIQYMYRGEIKVEVRQPPSDLILTRILKPCFSGKRTGDDSEHSSEP